MTTPSGQRPFPIPLVSAMGPGSQIEDEELDYLPMPQGMSTYQPPRLPEPDALDGHGAAIAVLDQVLAVLPAAIRGEPVAPVDLSGLGAADREIVNQALGALVMGAFYILICSIMIWFMVKAQFLNPQTIEESKTYPLMEPLPGKAYDVALRLKPFAEEAWGSSMTWMDRLQKYGDDKTKTLPESGKVYKPDQKTIENDPNTGYTPPSKTNYPPEDSDGIEE